METSFEKSHDVERVIHLSVVSIGSRQNRRGKDTTGRAESASPTAVESIKRRKKSGGLACVGAFGTPLATPKTFKQKLFK